MMFFLLVCGAVIAYVLQNRIGVAYYLLILDAVIAGFTFCNQKGGGISPLNVHRGRVAEFGLLDGAETATFDGIPAEDVMSLRADILFDQHALVDRTLGAQQE